MDKKSGSGFGIRNEQPGSYFLELRTNFLGSKYLNSFMRIRDPDPGWKKFGSGILDPEKHSGSATLVSETLYLLAKLALLHMHAELIPWKFLHSLKV